MSCGASTPIHSEENGRQSARQAKLVPIFNNSPPPKANDAGDVEVSHMPNSGELTKSNHFPYFPLPWSVLLPPIPGLSGVVNEDYLVPILEETDADGAKLGYYLFNPLGNDPLFGGRSHSASDASILLERDGVFYSHPDIDTPEELTNHVLKSSQGSFGAPNSRFSSTPSFFRRNPSFFSSPALPTSVSGWDSSPLIKYPAQPFVPAQPFTFSHQSFGSQTPLTLAQQSSIFSGQPINPLLRRF